MDLIQAVSQISLVEQWQRQIKEEQERQLLTGLAGSAKTLAIASTYQTFQRPILSVVPNL